MEYFEYITETVRLLDRTVSVKKVGASPDELSSLEGTVGYKLPNPFISLYSTIDGEINGFSKGLGVFCGYTFLSAAEILDAYFYQKNLTPVDPVLLEYQGIPRSFPEGTVTDFSPCGGWVPFACVANSYLAIDLTPGPKGIYGQVINYGRDDDCNFQISEDIGSFLSFVLQSAQRKINFQEYFPETLGLYDNLYRNNLDSEHGFED